MFHPKRIKWFSEGEATPLVKRRFAGQSEQMLAPSAGLADLPPFAALACGPAIEQAHFSLWDAEGICLATMRMDGTPSSLTLDFRTMLWLMAKTRAASALLAHVHPSGDPMPSRSDVEVTRRLWRASRLLGVRLHDHVIHGDGARFSFRAAGLL